QCTKTHEQRETCRQSRHQGQREINVFSGIIRCADCGAAMAFNRKVSKNGVEHRFYHCSRYADSGSKFCSMHTIDAGTLESIILSDIQYHAQVAIEDEKKLTDRLLSFSGQGRQSEKAAQEKSLRDAKSRIAFIEDASKRLFEEKISGNVPESLFRKMLADYEHELAGLEEKAVDLRRTIKDEANGKADLMKWISLVKECISIDKLDRATAFQLIDHVAVHEQADKTGIRPKPFKSNTISWGI
ncbi:MAG: recombinase zinc beta ribbon domain-containing protein, partial [Christensenellales bacterium]